jgi:hypothetical protein
MIGRRGFLGMLAGLAVMPWARKKQVSYCVNFSSGPPPAGLRRFRVADFKKIEKQLALASIQPVDGFYLVNRRGNA